VYASQQHEQFLPDGTRAGFLIGDGAGVGKGRTIAGQSTLQHFFWLGKKRKTVLVTAETDACLSKGYLDFKNWLLFQCFGSGSRIPDLGVRVPNSYF
jgi:hypothetical protein